MTVDQARIDLRDNVNVNRGEKHNYIWDDEDALNSHRRINVIQNPINSIICIFFLNSLFLLSLALAQRK